MASKTQYKVVLLGEGCVGKTSLVMRYVSNTFNEKHITTIQALFVPKRLNLDGQSMTMNIWDTAGQEKYHALGPIYYRDADGAVLVYDITDVDSFNKVQTWVKELRKMLGKDIELIIAGNKSDMEKNRNVTLAEAEASVGYSIRCICRCTTLFHVSETRHGGQRHVFGVVEEWVEDNYRSYQI